MLEKLTHKQRKMAYIALGLLGLWLVYTRGISSCLDTIGQLQAVSKGNTQSSESIIQEISVKKKLLADLAVKDPSTDLPIQLTHEVNQYLTSHKGITIYEVPSARIIDRDGNEFQVYNITLEGNYNDLIQLAQYLENHRGIGKMISATFYTKRDYSKKQDHLHMRLEFQNLRLT